MSAELVKQDVVWVDKNEQLESICEILSEKKLLAVDTEFMRSRTYYPIAGLIQINDGSKSYLIDPCAVDDFYPLIEILDDTNIVKVLHSCSEDLEVFYHALGCLPRNIIDTQIAAAIAGFGYSIGFANIVREVLQVDLPKSETRSDWLQRPLSEAQLRYAAIDVEYLYQLASKLNEIIESLGRSDWLNEDSKRILDNFFDNQDPERSFARIKSAWKLRPRELLALKRLTRWREDTAQEKNIPRNRLLKEGALYTLAQKQPTHISQLRGIEGMSERMIRGQGEKIIQIMEEVKTRTDDELPSRLPSPLNVNERGVLDLLKQASANVAEELKIPAELLIKKKEYEFIMHSLRDGEAKLPDSLTGWRENLIGQKLLSIVKS